MTIKRSTLVLICALASSPTIAEEPAKSAFLIELERSMQQAADCAADKQEAEKRRSPFEGYTFDDQRDSAANNYGIRIDRGAPAPKVRCPDEERQ